MAGLAGFAGKLREFILARGIRCFLSFDQRHMAGKAFDPDVFAIDGVVGRGVVVEVEIGLPSCLGMAGFALRQDPQLWRGLAAEPMEVLMAGGAVAFKAGKIGVLQVGLGALWRLVTVDTGRGLMFAKQAKAGDLVVKMRDLPGLLTLAVALQAVAALEFALQMIFVKVNVTSQALLLG